MNRYDTLYRKTFILPQIYLGIVEKEKSKVTAWGYSASGVPPPECSAGWVSVLGTG